MGGNEAGGEARDPGADPGCSEMVEQGGGGRYRWLVRKAEHEAVAGGWHGARQSMQRQPMAGMGIK